MDARGNDSHRLNRDDSIVEPEPSPIIEIGECEGMIRLWVEVVDLKQDVGVSSPFGQGRVYGGPAIERDRVVARVWTSQTVRRDTRSCDPMVSA